MRKKIKCYKCSLYFKDREDPEDGETINKSLCWNCRFVWQCIGSFLKSLNYYGKINRQVIIKLDDVIIRKDIYKP